MATKSTDCKPSINVTPLIDVLLVLLIIFMVVSPAKQRKLDSKVPERPQAEAEMNPPAAQLVLSIDLERNVRLNSQPVRIEDLGRYLKDVFDKRPTDNRTLFIKAPRELSYGWIVNVIDLAKGAGARPVGLQIDYPDDVSAS